MNIKEGPTMSVRLAENETKTFPKKKKRHENSILRTRTGNGFEKTIAD